MRQKATAKTKKATVRMSIKRASGRVHNVGIVSGGAWWQRALANLRIMWLNLRTKGGF
jgi:hypothetical protein